MFNAFTCFCISIPRIKYVLILSGLPVLGIEHLMCLSNIAAYYLYRLSCVCVISLTVLTFEYVTCLNAASQLVLANEHLMYFSVYAQLILTFEHFRELLC